jgi:hypothetical protein
MPLTGEVAVQETVVSQEEFAHGLGLLRSDLPQVVEEVGNVALRCRGLSCRN